jgi:bifunctional non-homologous end joining protein LigD
MSRTIPAGEYGGGKVETWDRGTWEPITDPDAGMRKGELKFVLTGRRLNGRFTLVRLHRRDPRKQEAWFLIKGHDEEARKGVSAPVLEHEPLASRRRGDSGRWGDRPPAPGAVRGTPPADQAPQLCKLVEDPPDGANWISEIKFDGIACWRGSIREMSALSPATAMTGPIGCRQWRGQSDNWIFNP